MRFWVTIVLTLTVLASFAMADNVITTQSRLEKQDGVNVPPDPSVILQGGDNCSDFVELTGDLPITDNGNTAGYTNDYGPYSSQPDCWQGGFYSSSSGAPDVVYKFTAPATASYTFSLCGSSYDTGLELYHFTCPDEPTMDDFICGNDDACDLQSELTGIMLNAGDEILIVVDGYSSNTGNYTLTVDAEIGACCVDLVCVGTMGESDCSALGGEWYQGENCDSFECPVPPLDCSDAVYSNGDQIGSAFASQCDIVYPMQAEACDDFVLPGEDQIAVTSIVGWMGFWNHDPIATPANLDGLIFTIYNDDNGAPGGHPIDEDPFCDREGDIVWTHNYAPGEFGYLEESNGYWRVFVTLEDGELTLDPGVTYWIGWAGQHIFSNTGQGGPVPTGSQTGSYALLYFPLLGYNDWTNVWNQDMAFCINGEPAGGGEELVYSESFDNGMGDWSGGWALTAAEYVSPPNSLTDSPGGNYGDNQTNSVQMNSDIDLSGYFGARLEFQTKFELEQGFDYVYMYVSTNGGTSWSNIATFNGEDPDDYTWHLYMADLGGYVGQSIRFKFTLDSDGAYNVDGMYIDDFNVFGLSTDTSPPLIVHEGPDETTSVPEAYTAVATITDISGVESAWLSYSVDGGEMEIANPDSVVGDDYYFTIPPVEAGAHVEYTISANDNENNEGSTPLEHYVSGTVIYYDDGDPEYIYQYNPGDKVATRFTPDGSAVLVTGLLRLYTDVSHDLDTVDVQVWDNGSGNMPGNALIDPMAVWPMSTLDDPQGWTYVDFRGMGITVDDDFHFGYTYRSTNPVILGDSPAITGRSNYYMAGTWFSATTDYHIRAIVDYGQVGIEDQADLIPNDFTIKQNYPNPFNATTVIEYAIKNPGNVEVSVFNVLGQKVATLASGYHNAGEYSVTWDAGNVPSGVYFAKVMSSERSESVKMVLLK